MTSAGRRWRALGLLALGIALGIALTATTATSHVAGWAHNWNAHIKPRGDKRYLPGGNLPRGHTIRGTYDARGVDPGSGTFTAASAISFGVGLASAPVPHFVAFGAPTVNCPGSHVNPRARPGHLCVYEGADLNATNVEIRNPNSNSSGATRWGADVVAESVGDGQFWVAGTWAVRSP